MISGLCKGELGLEVNFNESNPFKTLTNGPWKVTQVGPVFFWPPHAPSALSLSAPSPLASLIPVHRSGIDGIKSNRSFNSVAAVVLCN